MENGTFRNINKDILFWISNLNLLVKQTDHNQLKTVAPFTNME